MFKGVKKNQPLCWEWEAKGKYVLDNVKNMGTAGAEGSVLCDHTPRVIVPRPFDVPACATVASSLCIVTACPT